eukprot:TRINITY_DN419_c0_g1_i2.p1 TRINITY_DN419_c0_g1~~TRINITY_DN419_c0_g1_i2.p1  ORF type:complete len:866 (+),score=402.41 TRINITY_DN419_c0_g1_i2:84-2600(+)
MAVPKVWLRVGDEDGERYIAEARAEITQFRVFTRVRPFIAEEKKRFGGDGELTMRSVVEMEVEEGKDGEPVETTYVCDPKDNWRRTHSFTYDRCLWSIQDKLIHTCKSAVHKTWVNQEECYRVAVTDPNGYTVVDNAFLGINSHIMTYGQTSSGKTYTMLGNYADEEADSDRGIIPRVCDELFRKVEERRRYEEKKKDPKKRWTLEVSVSFVEIYCEKVRNLLDDGNIRRPTHHNAGDVRGGQMQMKEARIRGEGTPGGPYLEGVEPKKVENWDDCKRYLKIGSKHRTTAATLVHDQSSRSHAIFSVILSQTRDSQSDELRGRYDKQKQQAKVGRVNLVDLAGSERSGGTHYQHEGAAINSSLLVLRKVIDALAERQQIRFEQLTAERRGVAPPSRRPPEVPQRESVLTRLLDLEGANAKAVMIANLTPSHEFYDETLRTLEWSHKSRRLVTVVRANVSDDAEVLEGRMKAQNQRLMGNLKDQKHNVDSLHNELAHRAQLIKDFTKANEKAEERIQKLDEKYRNAKAKRNATFIQLFFYRNMLAKVRARREKQLQQKEEERAAVEQEYRGVQEDAEQLQEHISEQAEVMDRIRAKVEYFITEVDLDQLSAPTADVAGMKEEGRKAQEELATKKAALEQAQQQRMRGEEAYKRFEAAREADDDRYRKEQQEQEAGFRRLQDDMLRDLLSDLTPEDVLENLGVGPVPDDIKAGGHPEVKYGEYVADECGDKGLRVFEQAIGDEAGDAGIGEDTVTRAAHSRGRWVVTEEVQRRLREAKALHADAEQRGRQLKERQQQLEASAGQLQQECQKAQQESNKLSAATSSLDQQIKALQAKKACC